MIWKDLEDQQTELASIGAQREHIRQLVGTASARSKKDAVVIETDIFRSLTNAENLAVATTID